MTHYSLKSNVYYVVLSAVMLASASSSFISYAGSHEKDAGILRQTVDQIHRLTRQIITSGNAATGIEGMVSNGRTLCSVLEVKSSDITKTVKLLMKYPNFAKVAQGVLNRIERDRTLAPLVGKELLQATRDELPSITKHYHEKFLKLVPKLAKLKLKYLRRTCDVLNAL